MRMSDKVTVRIACRAGARDALAVEPRAHGQPQWSYRNDAKRTGNFAFDIAEEITQQCSAGGRGFRELSARQAMSGAKVKRQRFGIDGWSIKRMQQMQ